MSEMITANRLSDGIVVFLDPEGGWTEDFHRAHVIDTSEAKATALAAAAKGRRTTSSSSPTPLNSNSARAISRPRR